MSIAVGADGTAVAGPRLAIKSLRGGLLWLTGLAGAFVFIEPSPYELVALGTMFVFAVTGLSLRPALSPLILLLVFLNIGYAMAVVQVSDESKPVIWVLVSIFLSATAIFFAAMLGGDTERRLKWLMRGYIAAAVIASLVAIAAYFHLFGERSETFLLYGRARGTFNDPNVLGAFLVLPALLMVQRMLADRLSQILSAAIVFLILMGGLFLSFSRAAWGQFAFAGLVLMALTFITSRSASERLRIVLIAILGLVLMAVFVAALLSIEQVAELFKERATLEQSYDVGHYGRFGRYMLGVELGLERPFGLGPLQFTRIFPEDPHNSYLNSFMTGGWLAGFSYLTLTAVTLIMGLRFAFVTTPWRSIYLAVYAAYVGVAGESAIIDSDHWRHYFLILGILWGLMAVSQAYLRAVARAPSSAPA